MYIFPEMIEMGLKEGQKFPSEAHKQVASTIGLCNPLVKQLDTLIDIVQAVLTIPNDKIKLVKVEDLTVYGCPIVW